MPSSVVIAAMLEVYYVAAVLRRDVHVFVNCCVWNFTAVKLWKYTVCE